MWLYFHTTTSVNTISSPMIVPSIVNIILFSPFYKYLPKWLGEIQFYLFKIATNIAASKKMTMVVSGIISIYLLPRF